MKTIITTLFFACTIVLYSQNVTIPDANFKALLTTQ